MRLKSKPWAKPLIAAHPQYVIRDTDPVVLQPSFQHLALEIGTGKGDFIVGKMLQQPTTFFYGIERATTVLAFALKKLLEFHPKNVQLILGDFAKASFQMPAAMFDHIYLNFSDPWPKLRHHKRRLTALGNLEKISKVLKVNGYIFLKTDNQDLFDFSLVNLEKMHYNIIRIQRPYDVLDPDDILTEYEGFFRSQGQPIYRVIAQRREDVNPI
jgi:tRNA (guanine-N7-)-methyltransferase